MASTLPNTSFTSHLILLTLLGGQYSFFTDEETEG